MLLVRNRMRRWCSGHLFVCSCDSAVSFFLLPGKFKQTSTAAKRRVQFARPWTQASKPALTVYSLAAKIRTVALHVAFFSTKNLCPARCCCCCRCVYSRMIYLATKDARCVHCSSWSLGPSPRRPTASYNSLAAVRRGDCVRKS